MDWLRRRLEQLRRCRFPAAFVVNEAWGPSFLINELRSDRRPLIWIQFDDDDENDPISQGNKLADALEHALGSPILGYGLPIDYGLEAIFSLQGELGPFTLAISNGQKNLDLINQIADWQSEYLDIAVMIAPGESTPRSVSGDRENPYTVIDEAWLRLSEEEAAHLWSGNNEDLRWKQIYCDCDGAYEAYLIGVRKVLGLPPLMRPSPTGPVLIPVGKQNLSKRKYFDVLVQRQHWIDAFELAALSLPSRISEVIAQAGDQYFEKGLFERFWRYISHVPSEHLKTDIVQYWYYSSAISVNRHQPLQEEIVEYLSSNSAPDLRAIVAGLRSVESSLSEARRAFKDEETTITSRVLGILSRQIDVDFSTSMLRKSFRLAEEAGNRHQTVAAVCAVVGHEIENGNYQDAVLWGEWGLKYYTENGLHEELRHIELISNYSYARILSGRAQGIKHLLESVQLPPSFPKIPGLEAIQSVRGDLEFVEGRIEGAYNLYLSNYRNLPHHLIAYGASDVVRALIRMGRKVEALTIASEALTVTRFSGRKETLLATLAWGSASSALRQEAGAEKLQCALQGFLDLNDADRAAQAGIRLAMWYLDSGNQEEALNTLNRARGGLDQLGRSGWVLFCGSEDDAMPMLSLWHGLSTELEIECLGQRGTIRSRHSLDLPLKWLEILTILALHPSGLTSDQLTLLLYGERGNRSTVKATLSKLRRQVPIESRPYRIGVDFVADFLEVERLLREGKVRDAVERYRGPLLPGSDAPGVVEARHRLEESVRQAALSSRSSEVMLPLAYLLDDDLELWEATSTVVSRNDPQYPLIRARIKRIRGQWMGSRP